MTIANTESRCQTVDLPVTCPPWCTLSAEDHARQLWDLEGHCIHYGYEVLVPDPSPGPGVGYYAAEHDGKTLPTFLFRVGMSVETKPDGDEVSHPTLFVDDQPMSFAHVEAVIAALREAMAVHAAWKADQS